MAKKDEGDDMPTSLRTDTEVALSRLLRVWSKGRPYHCAPEDVSDGTLVIRVTACLPASHPDDDPLLAVPQHSDEQLAAMLLGAQKQVVPWVHEG